MFAGYIVVKTKAVTEIRLPKQEQVEQWILLKLGEYKEASGILVDEKSGKPIREYHNDSAK